MKHLLIAFTAVFALAAQAAEDPKWNTDFAKAKETAKSENKAILIDFTGSDWCGWCKKMKKDSLDTAEFKQFAAKNLVLVEADFPSKKPLSDEQKKANDKLKTQYKVSGFPTFVLLDSNGKELGRQVGYLQGGPSAFIEKIEGLNKKK